MGEGQIVGEEGRSFRGGYDVTGCKSIEEGIVAKWKKGTVEGGRPRKCAGS